MQRLRTGVLLLAIGACRTPSSGATPSLQASSDPAAEAEGAALAHPASPPPQAETPEAPPDSVVHAWNEALSRHDLEALGALYAAQVLFYGTNLTRDACVQAKREAFRKTPDYRQKLRDDRVTIEPIDAEHVRARFTKISSASGKDHAFEASLVLSHEDGQWRIAEESDQATDSRHAQTCEDAVMSAAMSTPPARAFLDAPVPAEAVDAGFLSRGGMVYPRNEGETRYTVALHSSFTDRMANEVWLEVDPKTGTVYQDTGRVRAEAALESAVVRACR
jgi:ketosteroid isomerase-like protein